MKRILVFILLLVFLLLLWFTRQNYQTCCGDSTNNTIEKVTKTPIKEVKKDGALVYKWNSDEALTNDLWDAKKTEILSAMADGKILRILGPYFKEEGEEIGIARAKSAFSKLNSIDSTKVEYASKLIPYYDGAKTTNFGGTNFNWLVRNNNITEIDNKALIYE